MSQVSIEHIAIDARGNAHLAGSRIKVKHIVQAKQSQGYSPEQLQSEAYPHLSLGQIYAALAYYHDHKQEIDTQIKDDDAFYEEQLEKQRNDPEFQSLAAKLKARAAGK